MPTTASTINSFSILPPEIKALIFNAIPSCCSKAELANFICISRDTYSRHIGRLYECVELTRHNASPFFREFLSNEPVKEDWSIDKWPLACRPDRCDRPAIFHSGDSFISKLHLFGYVKTLKAQEVEAIVHMRQAVRWLEVFDLNTYVENVKEELQERELLRLFPNAEKIGFGPSALWHLSEQQVFVAAPHCALYKAWRATKKHYCLHMPNKEDTVLFHSSGIIRHELPNFMSSGDTCTVHNGDPSYFITPPGDTSRLSERGIEAKEIKMFVKPGEKKDENRRDLQKSKMLGFFNTYLPTEIVRSRGSTPQYEAPKQFIFANVTANKDEILDAAKQSCGSDPDRLERLQSVKIFAKGDASVTACVVCGEM
ncbi:hypothetical protein IAR50_007412 [Cryptococcus sp. DSM 104548]